MVRITTPFFYTVEFLVALSVFLVVLFFFLRKTERKSLIVFIIAGGINSGIELLLQGTGMRVIEDAALFNIPIGFPSICFILGFYEGGVKTLIAYHFVRTLMNSDKFSKIFLIALVVLIFNSFFSYAAFITSGWGSSSLTITARNMLAPLGIILLLVAFAGSFGYFLLKKIPRNHKVSLLYYQLGLVIYLLVWMIPLHIFSLRFIGDVLYVPVGIFEQLVWMYGYFLFFEGIGVIIVVYPVIYGLDLMEFEKIEKKS